MRALKRDHAPQAAPCSLLMLKKPIFSMYALCCCHAGKCHRQPLIQKQLFIAYIPTPPLCPKHAICSHAGKCHRQPPAHSLCFKSFCVLCTHSTAVMLASATGRLLPSNNLLHLSMSFVHHTHTHTHTHTPAVMLANATGSPLPTPGGPYNASVPSTPAPHVAAAATIAGENGDRTHTHTLTHTCTHTCTHTRAHTHTLTHSHTHTLTHTPTHIHTHVHMHTCTYTPAHPARTGAQHSCSLHWLLQPHL